MAFVDVGRNAAGGSPVSVTVDVGSTTGRVAMARLYILNTLSVANVTAVRDPAGVAEAMTEEAGTRARRNDSGTLMEVVAFWLDLGDALSGVQTFEFTSDAGTTIAAQVVVYDGLASGGPEAVDIWSHAADEDGGNTTTIGGSITTTTDGAIVVGFPTAYDNSFSIPEGAFFTPLDGQTERDDYTPGTVYAFGVGELVVATAGLQGFTWQCGDGTAAQDVRLAAQPLMAFAPAGAGGTPVSRAGSTPIEHLAPAVASGSTPIEWRATTSAVSRSEATPIEWVSPVSRAGASPLEHLEGFALAWPTPIEYLAPARRSGSTPLEWQSVGVVSRTGVTALEWLRALEAVDVAPVEWLAAARQAGATPIEWDGSAAAVSRVGVTSLEHVAPVQRVGATPIESRLGVRRAGVTSFEHGLGIVVVGATSVEWLRRISAADPTSIEWLTGVRAVGVTPIAYLGSLPVVVVDPDNLWIDRGRARLWVG